MTTLFTTKQNWVKGGILQHTVLQHVWKEFSPNVSVKKQKNHETFEKSMRVNRNFTRKSFA